MYPFDQVRWCRNALAIQNASNPSGVAHAIADTTSEMVSSGLSTVEIQCHPALALMAAKLADLCGIDYQWPEGASLQAQQIAAAPQELPQCP